MKVFRFGILGLVLPAAILSFALLTAIPLSAQVTATGALEGKLAEKRPEDLPG